MKIVTVDQMRRLEQRADTAGVTYARMMECAGRAVAKAMLERWDLAGRRVLLLVGPGNNGGDGLVAARHLHDAGALVTLYLWKRQTDHDANYGLSQERHIAVTSAEDDAALGGLRAALAACDFVVDALLGTGANRPIEGPLKEILVAVKAQMAVIRHPASELQSLAPIFSPDRLLRAIEGHPSSSVRRLPSPLVVAVDLPSGVNADTGAVDPATVPASLTVTFACPKIGFFRFPAAAVLGELVVADIGIPPALDDDIALNIATLDLIHPLLPARPRSGHKGTFGKAMLVAGGANYTGAPYLSAAAAARVGAGLVTLAATRDVQRVVAASLHEPTWLPLPAAGGYIAAAASRVVLAALDGYDALLVGPGLGHAAATRQFVGRLLGISRRISGPKLPPLIVDADGLNALSEQPHWWERLSSQSILTPHEGEFARLSKLSAAEISADRIGCARACAHTWNQIVLLKGAFTIIGEPDGQVTLLPFANPALATAGSGDVLSGVIVGLLAQGLSTRAAALAGGYLHGTAGELVRLEIGDAGALAGDLLPRLPRALRALKA
jgi:hydroxyethylthiazole kinase-like uncharacterized protein yjeF